MLVGRSSNRFGDDERNCVAAGYEIRHGMVGDIDIEFLFKRHRALENIQAIGPLDRR